MPHFWGMHPGGCDPQIRTWLRFLYNAPTVQVLSSYVYSFGSYRVDKQQTNMYTHTQTNKQAPQKTSNVLRYATTLGITQVLEFSQSTTFRNELTMSHTRHSRSSPRQVLPDNNCTDTDIWTHKNQQPDGTWRTAIDGYTSACCDLLIPKSNQHFYEPKYICGQNWMKFPSMVFEIWCLQGMWEAYSQMDTQKPYANGTEGVQWQRRKNTFKKNTKKLTVIHTSLL